MATLSLADVVAGNDTLALDINNNNATLESVVNALDTNNWASGKIFAANKITQGGATVGQILTWDGTDWATRTPIYVVQYNPATVAESTTTSTTGADLDATNLSLAINVTSSGKILVYQNACARNVTGPAGANNSFWGLRESLTDVAYAKIVTNAATGAINDRFTLLYLVTGLSSGAHTYKWAQKTISGAQNIGTSYGTQATPASSDPGPATMVIVPLPT